MSDLSREKMEEKYGISANTIQSWEAAKAGGLTQKGADRIISSFHAEGISCSLEWLLYGIGSSPILRTAERYLIHGTITDYLTSMLMPEDKVIVSELQTFRTLNVNTLDMLVADNGMLPYYRPGDYVAGKRRRGDDIEQMVGKNCIVEMATNEILLRRIRSCQQSGLYNLTCINPDTNLQHPTLYQQKLLSVAPVVWHRRPDAYSLQAPTFTPTGPTRQKVPVPRELQELVEVVDA